MSYEIYEELGGSLKHGGAQREMNRLDDIRRDLESIVSKINNHVYAPGQLRVVVMRHADAQDILRVAFDLLDLVERAVPMAQIIDFAGPNQGLLAGEWAASRKWLEDALEE